MDLSIIVVSYNGRDFLRRCLASLFDHVRDIEFEVIVVDNASHDGTPEMVEAEFQQATLLRRTANAGFARAVNEGIAATSGDAVFVLNPDTVLTGNIFPPMLGYLQGHEDTGVLAPKLLDEDGSLQYSCRSFPNFGTAIFNRYSLLTRLLPGNRFSNRYLMKDFGHDEIRDVDWISAAAWLLPQSTFEKVGPLDEGYFWSIEDVDYCQRVHRAGLRVVYFPDVTVQHVIGGSSATLPSRTIIERHRGMWRYYRSYLRPHRQPAAALMDVAVRAGIWSRAGAQLAVNGLRRTFGASG